MRAKAREVAFKKIYESLFISNDDIDVFFDMEKLEDKNDQNFANELIGFYVQNKDNIESLIKKYLKDYDLDRVYKIDRAIICLAISEYVYQKQTPKAVVINECVSLAKKFGTDKSYAFVNAILKSIFEEVDGQ